MKKFRRFIAILLCVLLTWCYSPMAFAEGPIIEEEMSFTELNNVSVTHAINTYFNQRHEFLMGNADYIPNGNVPLNNDEVAHKSAMETAGVVRTGMQITIDEIRLADTFAEADVMEIVYYRVGGFEYTEEIVHFLSLYPNTAKGILVVAEDGYSEPASNFYSGCYVPAYVSSTSSDNTGSPLCIIHIAEGEIGYIETGVNITKYGEWYGDNGEPWCAMFVSWCAYFANIPETIIKRDYGCDGHKNFFSERGRYYVSAEYDGNTFPQAGDIIFFGDDQTDAEHVGIVTGADNTYVYYIDGNGTGDGSVTARTKLLSAFNILGYGRPNYSTTDHVHNYYEVINDDVGHHKFCINCSAENVDPHTFSEFYDDSHHWNVCVYCGYTTTGIVHNTYYEHNATYHWLACSGCNWESNTRNLHNLILGGIGQPSTCRVCDYVSYGGTLNSIIHNLKYEVT